MGNKAGEVRMQVRGWKRDYYTGKQARLVIKLSGRGRVSRLAGRQLIA
jgi:hypothetical protein